LFHYTNDKGHKAISSQHTWLFKASRPPCNHPKAAYFTDLPPGTKNLGKRLFVRGCKDKIGFVFCFSGGEDLTPIDGSRGEHVFFSKEDYPVVKERQGPHDPAAQVQKELE
jgi:hypothetical protein